MSNAASAPAARPRRAGSGTIEAVARRTPIALVVVDDGPGFPPDFSEEAFERFTRADMAPGRGGAGLGLSIVRAIAEAHGGPGAQLTVWRGRRMDLAPGGRRRRRRCFGPRLGEAPYRHDVTSARSGWTSSASAPRRRDPGGREPGRSYFCAPRSARSSVSSNASANDTKPALQTRPRVPPWRCRRSMLCRIGVLAVSDR